MIQVAEVRPHLAFALSSSNIETSGVYVPFALQYAEELTALAKLSYRKASILFAGLMPAPTGHTPNRESSQVKALKNLAWDGTVFIAADLGLSQWKGPAPSWGAAKSAVCTAGQQPVLNSRSWRACWGRR